MYKFSWGQQLIACWLLGSAACFHGEVVAEPAAIAAVAAELRASGSAVVEAREHAAKLEWRATTATLTLRDHLEVRMPPAAPAAPAAPPAPSEAGEPAVDQTSPAPAPPLPVYAKLAVGDILSDCPAHAFPIDAKTRGAYPRCALLVADAGKIVVDHRAFPPTGGIAAGVVLAAIGGLAVCTFECERPWSRISGGVLIAGGVVLTAASIALVAYLTSLRNH